MSLGKVAVTRLGSGTGPIGSLTVTPTFGSFCARAAKPPAPIPADTTAHKANLMAERMSFSPWNYGEMIGRNCDQPQRAGRECARSKRARGNETNAFATAA